MEHYLLFLFKPFLLLARRRYNRQSCQDSISRCLMRRHRRCHQHRRRRRHRRHRRKLVFSLSSSKFNHLAGKEGLKSWIQLGR